MAPSCSFHMRSMARDDSAAVKEATVEETQELADQFKLTYRPDNFDIKKPSEKVERIVQEIMELNLYEAVQVTDLLKDRFGITDEAQLYGFPAGGAGAAPAAAAAPAGEEAKEEVVEQTEFVLKLESFDAKSKIKVIKEIRAITGLGLKQAKEFVEGAPSVIKEAVSKAEGEEIAAKLKEIGGVCALE